MSDADILAAHARAVKAAMRYEAASRGTQNSRRLFEAWQKAEERFERIVQAIRQNP